MSNPPLKNLASLPSVWIGWLVARVLLVVMLLCKPTPLGDLYYYFNGVYGTNPTDMTEYPQPGTWPSVLIAWLTGPHEQRYFVGFTVMTLLADATFLALLLRQHRGRSEVFYAAWFWIFFGTAAGHVFAWRLDLYPALLVAGAGSLLATRPRVAAGLLGWATAVKLWPGVLAAGLVGRYSARDTWKRLGAYFAAILALCAGVAALSGVDRLLSPLSYQGERGLQIESVAATVLMVGAYYDPQRWDAHYAPSKSFEISGPGVNIALAISTIAMAAALMWALGVALSRFLRGGWNPRSTAVFFVAAILLLIATNKVFSTQYIVWLGPILAVALRTEVPRTTRAQRRVAAQTATYRRALAVLTVLAAALGTYIYPWGYDYLWLTVGANPIPVYALAVRNALILAMVLIALLWHRAEYRIQTGHARPAPADYKSI